MAALARAVAGLLARGGWLVALLLLEFGVLVGFWWSGPTPFAEAFDRRAAEADLLLLTLNTLPALFAGALLAAGDREDGMADFYRSCRVSPLQQTLGTALGLFVVTGGALVVATVGSLLLAAPTVLAVPATWTSLALALVSNLIHGLWGLALGSRLRSRWSAVAAALGFWIVAVLVLESLVTALAAALPARWALPTVLGLIVLDPSELVRAVTVMARGQAWVFGPALADVREVVGAWGSLLLLGLAAVHLAVPLSLASLGRRSA